jgi:transcriptional regulator with PAS, ATPase and Fis domain
MSDQETEALVGETTTSLRVRAATVDVRDGVDRGRSVRVETPSFSIGSGTNVDMRLHDKTVSREHLRLAVAETGVRVRDHDSRNGTWLGASRIYDALFTGDVTLRIGETHLTLRIDTATSDLVISDREQFGEAFARSPAMRHAFSLLERVATSDVNVLLEGESGVGKDVLAHAIHAASARSGRPFVAVDCGAIPAGLVESELFGHVQGAFTGAHRGHLGATEQAHGGTLFFDEIGELPLDLQPKLLRFLETREVRPVGSGSARKVDIRIVAATNRRLAEAVENGTFRKDLFYRLSVARVIVPPLRDRPEDVGMLATIFLQRVTGDRQAQLPADLEALLGGYSWPGNVRELRNVIERYAALGVRDARGLFDAGTTHADGWTESTLLTLDFHEARRRTLERFEKAYLNHALVRAGGVVTRAAELAKIARPSFYRMLNRTRDDSRDDEEDADGGT